MPVYSDEVAKKMRGTGPPSTVKLRPYHAMPYSPKPQYTLLESKSPEES
jgi:hypothetical protein